MKKTPKPIDPRTTQEYLDGCFAYDIHGNAAECPHPQGPPVNDLRVRWWTGFLDARTKAVLGF